MKSLCTDLPSPQDFDDSVNVAREHLRLSLAYTVAHHKLACADVVVRAAAAFTGATENDEFTEALDNLFDAVKTFREAMESLEKQDSSDDLSIDT